MADKVVFAEPIDAEMVRRIFEGSHDPVARLNGLALLAALAEAQRERDEARKDSDIAAAISNQALRERDEARAKLDKPCGECHPCTEWPAETWRRSGARLPDVHEWNAVVAERDAAQRREELMRQERDEARDAQIVVQCDDPGHAERELMRPVVEAAQAYRASKRDGYVLDAAAALVVAVDTYETQERTE